MMVQQMLKNGIIQSGAVDIRRAAQALGVHLPSSLAPLARIAYNYRWIWHPDGEQVFHDIDAYRWQLCRQNPVRFLLETPRLSLELAVRNRSLIARIESLRECLEDELNRSPSEDGIDPRNPIALFCIEFGIHWSMPLYSGGLGIFAGDLLKEASDRALPTIGIGLMYREGYFRQRVDVSGMQHEYWSATDPELCPVAKVTDPEGKPLAISMSIWGENVHVHIWRMDIGRVPVFLLDTEVPENTARQRFITTRLYEGNREIRLAQYALLGIGGIKVLHALGIEPSIIHLMEGHAALAFVEIVRYEMEHGLPFKEACDKARQKVVFTTHTPVPAGNETYSAREFKMVIPDAAAAMGVNIEQIMRLGRVWPDNRDEPPGMTVLAIRMSRSTNGISRIHGGMSRRMWQSLFPSCSQESVPITHVTNGAHPLTWIAPRLRRLLDDYLCEGWHKPNRVTDPLTWRAVEDIPDEQLWLIRNELRGNLISWVKFQSVIDRLRSGDSMDYALAAQQLDPNILTVGFAKRLATYKRLYLLFYDPLRLLRLLEGPYSIQLLFAGKAHPRDEEAKRMLQKIYELKADPRVGGRFIFLEDYDMRIAKALLMGCDLWLNLPRPPLEASGTSGMKAVFNGSLNLNVLDGWWAEAFDGTNGWAIDGAEDPNAGAKDSRDAKATYDLLENEVIPLFYDRDQNGIPVGWITRIKASLKTIGPHFCTARVLEDYISRIYTGAISYPSQHNNS